MNREIALNETYLPSQFEGMGSSGLNLCNVAKKIKSKNLTLNENYLNPNFSASSYQQTPFNEITNISISNKLPKDRSYLLDAQDEYDLPFDDIIKLIKDAIKGYIVKCWDPTKPKLFLHSSGYDSRIISGIITELREEKGDEWIGDIHFRCHQPEGKLFKKIMKAEGWKNHQFSLWEDVKENNDHYNLGRIEPVNGFMPCIQQYDFFSDYTKGREKDIIIIGGIYGGELFDYPARGKKHFKKFKYCDNNLFNSLNNYILDEAGAITQYFDDHNYAIFPFLSYDYLSVATRMPKKYIRRKKNIERTRPDNIREALVKSFKFDIYSIPYVGHSYSWNITNKTWNNMSNFYHNSKFYNDYKINIGIPFKLQSYEDYIWTFSILYDKIFK